MYCFSNTFTLVFPKKKEKTESRRVYERLLCAHRLLLDPEAKAGTFASSATNSPHKQEETKKDEIRCRLPLGTSSFSSSASSFVRIVALRPWLGLAARWMDGWLGWMTDACRASVVRLRSSGARGMDELIYFPARRLVVRARSRSASAWERTKDVVDVMASRSSRAFFFCDTHQ